MKKHKCGVSNVEKACCKVPAIVGEPSLLSRARKLDIAAAALAQRDRLAAEVEALRLIVKALEAENRRAWAMVRKLS